MGKFYYDGKNTILENLLSKLPDGIVYNKDANIIPYIDEITFIEFYNNYPDKTNVDIYIDGKLATTKKILPDKSIYYKFKPPYGKFRIQTYINNNLITDEYFISLNYVAFFLVLAKELNYDDIEIFKMFGNLYFDYLQYELIYKKWGWFFDFEQGSFKSVDYRRIILGDLTNCLGVVRSFMNAALEYGLKQLVKSFTMQEPIICYYREFDGWILRDTDIYPKPSANDLWWARFPSYYIDDNNTIPPSYKSKKIILMDKRFKLNCFIVKVINWTYGEAEKQILNNLIYKISPANLKIEIIYQ